MIKSSATKLSDAMRVGGWTAYALAKTLGISHQAVQQWRSGKAKPSPAHRAAVEAILGMSPDDFLDDHAAFAGDMRYGKVHVRLQASVPVAAAIEIMRVLEAG